MPLSIPNAQDSPTYQAQAVVDKTDLAALSLALQQTGVISGMLVTPGTGYSVNIALGVIQVGWDQQNVSSVANLAPLAASAQDRRDIVVCSITGVISIVSGTPTTETAIPWTNTSVFNPPVKPSIPANSVLLAEIYIPGGGGAVASSWITDKTTLTAILSTPWPEGLIRLNSLSQMRPPDSAVSWNGQRVANMANGAVPTDSAALGQLGGWINDTNIWTLSANTSTVAASSNTLTPTVSTTLTGSTINTTPSTVTVGTTTGFPASGSFMVRAAASPNGLTTVNYTAIGSVTTFTGCTLAASTVTTVTGDYVMGSLNVASTTGFPASGHLIVTHSATNYILYYLALTATAFVGCTGSAQTLSTSDVVSPNAFTVASATDYSGIYAKGTKIKWAEAGTVKYGVVRTSVFASSVTTIYVMATTDYLPLATADTTTNSYCYTNPPGFPTSFTYVPGWIGVVSPGLVNVNWWAVQNGICTLVLGNFAATSNATQLAYVGPINAGIAATITSYGVDNGANAFAALNQSLTTSASTGTPIVNVSKAPTGTWTASGTKSAIFTLSFPI